jgi:hypothetical protein
MPRGRDLRVEQRRSHVAGRWNHPDGSPVNRPCGRLDLAGRRCLKTESEDGKTYDNCRREAPQSNAARAVGPWCVLLSPMSCHRILLM